MKSLHELYAIVKDRKDNPSEGSYTNELLDHPEKVYRKINEETYETIYACLQENRDQVIYETSDLLYHLMVLLAKQDVAWDEILAELQRRHK